MSLKLSIAYITLNEELRLPQSLEAVRDVADEIVVVDSGSTDNTINVAKAYGSNVISRAWTGYGDQKNTSLKNCTGDLILSLDADEVPDKDLIAHLKRLKTSEDISLGYTINCKSVILGKTLDYTWQPDKHLRLVSRSSGALWSSDLVHEKLEIPNQNSYPTLDGFLIHYTYKSITHQMDKMMVYAKLAAEDMFASGRPSPKVSTLLLRPVWRFIRQFIIRGGFRDGIAGCIAVMGESYYVYLKYAFLYEKYNEEKKNR